MMNGVRCAVLFLFLMVWIALVFQAYAQEDSGSVTVIDTQPGMTGLNASELDSALVPSHAAVTLHTVHSKRLIQLESYYQRWKEQFPYQIMEYSYGYPQHQLTQIPRRYQREDWKFYLALLLLILLTIIRFGYAKEFDELFSAFRNWGPSQQMFRELGTGVSFGTVLLNIFSVMVLSLFVYLLLAQYNLLSVDPPWMMMIMTLALVAVFLLARYTLLKTAALLFPFGKEITLYNFYEIQINRVLGIALFPLVLLISFSAEPVSDYAFFAAVILLTASLAIRYLKGFNIGINYFGRHLFHFLLYICALEIAPVLIIIRLLQNLGPLRFSF